MDKRTKLRRFNLLVDMLENHKKHFPKVKFDLAFWAKNNKSNSKIECLLDGTCKTAACAIGSAMLFKPFNKMGLHGRFHNSHGNFAGGSGRSDFVPVYKHYKSWYAVHEFFNLSEPDADYLFQQDSYETKNPTPKTVANRVKKFIKNGFKI